MRIRVLHDRKEFGLGLTGNKYHKCAWNKKDNECQCRCFSHKFDMNKCKKEKHQGGRHLYLHNTKDQKASGSQRIAHKQKWILKLANKYNKGYVEPGPGVGGNFLEKGELRGSGGWHDVNHIRDGYKPTANAAP